MHALDVGRRFEGHPVTTLSWRGRPVWIAREIAMAAGYLNHGKRLVTQITREWAEEFIVGHDYEVLSGDDLSEFKIIATDGSIISDKTNRALVILYESGVHLALTKTNKPVGHRLRRWLVDEVLPAVTRGGRRTFSVDDIRRVDIAPEPACTVDAAFGAEQRRVAQLDLSDRRFRVATLHRTADILRALGRIDDDQYALLEVSACEIALGFPLIHLYPPPVRDAVASALGVPRDVEDAEEVDKAA